MRNYSFEMYYEKLPISKDNFVAALKRIGEVDPYNIKRTTLKRRPRLKSTSELSDNELVSRGVLNVRKQLNRNLGKNGKFSNNMIKNSAKIFSDKDKKTLKICIPASCFFKYSYLYILFALAGGSAILQDSFNICIR